MVLHVGPCCFQKLFLYLGVKQTTKKHKIATANPAPLGLVLPSVAFFPLPLWSRYLQTLAHDPRALSPGPGTQLRDWAPWPSLAAPQPGSLRFHRRLCLQVLDDLIYGPQLPLLPGILKPHGDLQSILSNFYVFVVFMEFSRQEYWSGLLFPSPVTTCFQNSPRWPVHLGWPYRAWFIVSLS